MKTAFKEILYKSSDWTTAVRLREKILREPLGSAFSAQELDEEKSHFQIAGFLDHDLISSAVLVPEGVEMKMQRVVVKENYRSMNVGSDMMIFCEKLAADKGFKVMYCHARDSAVNFYLKNGYTGIGNYFNEDGIPHLKMKKEL